MRIEFEYNEKNKASLLTTVEVILKALKRQDCIFKYDAYIVPTGDKK